MTDRETGGEERSGIVGLVQRVFADRQILIRTRDRVFYLPVSRALQIGLCVALIAATGWTGFASVRLYHNDDVVSDLQQRMADDHLAYRSLLAEVADFQRKFNHIADELDQNHDLMLSLVDQNASLQQSVLALRGQLQTSEKELDQEAAVRQTVEADLVRIESDLRELTERNGRLQRRLARVQDDVRTVMAERDRAQARGSQLAQNVEDLEQTIDGLQISRRDAVQRLADQTLSYMESIESVDKDLREAIQARNDAELESTRNAQSIEVLEGQVARLQGLIVDTEEQLKTRTVAYKEDIESARGDLRVAHGERNEATVAASRLEGKVRELDEQLNDLKNSRKLAERALTDQTVAYEVDIHGLRAGLTSAMVERDLALSTSNQLTDRVKSMEARLDDLHGNKLTAELRLSERTAAYKSELQNARRDLRATLEERNRAMVESSHRDRRIVELDKRLAELRTSKELDNKQFRDQTVVAYQEDIETLKSRLVKTEGERDVAIGTRDSLGSQVKTLETRLAGVQEAQEDAVHRLTERAVASIDDLQRVVKLTGLELTPLLALEDARYGSQGGPFVSVKPDGMPADRLLASLTVLDQHLEHWDALQSVIRRLPMTPPLENFQTTSRYGKRRDPINRRWAMHYGLDLGAVFKSPVHATAGGIVTHASWKGRYGRMVEIDHGAGLKTRYGHLHRISVKKGDRVSYHEKVGLLGSSGRSTGAHLHYEVVFQDKSMDPMKFIKAGRYVLQDNQNSR